MRRLTINGERLTVANSRELYKALGVDIHTELSKGHSIATPVGCGMYLYTGNMTRGQLYKAAGFDKLDFAVPIEAKVADPCKTVSCYDEQCGYGSSLFCHFHTDDEALKILTALVGKQVEKA